MASGEGARTRLTALKTQGNGLSAVTNHYRWMGMPGGRAQRKTRNCQSDRRLHPLWALPLVSYPSNPMFNTTPWFFWAVLSAVFAALTAIFAKIGIRGWKPTWQRRCAPLSSSSCWRHSSVLPESGATRLSFALAPGCFLGFRVYRLVLPGSAVSEPFSWVTLGNLGLFKQPAKAVLYNLSAFSSLIIHIASKVMLF